MGAYVKCVWWDVPGVWVACEYVHGCVALPIPHTWYPLHCTQESLESSNTSGASPTVCARHFATAAGRVAPSVSRADQRIYDALRTKLRASRSHLKVLDGVFFVYFLFPRGAFCCVHGAMRTQNRNTTLHSLKR